MFRLSNAFGLAFLLALLASLTVSAKGGFSFIVITGPGIEGETRSTDSNLTSDYFAFADFYRNSAEIPSDPGNGYEITRYYLEGNRESAFDRLHYYPEMGFVFYDGIVNGESEYDGKWYSANPAIKSFFESALLAAPVVKSSSGQSAERGEAQPQTAVSDALIQFIMPAAILSGLVVVLFFITRQRKVSAQ